MTRGPLPNLVAVLLLGLVVGAEVDCIGFMVRKYFPPAAFGRLYGVAFGLILVGTGTGPLLLSFLYDHFGGYGNGLLLFAAIGLLSAGLSLAIPRYEEGPVFLFLQDSRRTTPCPRSLLRNTSPRSQFQKALQPFVSETPQSKVLQAKAA